MMDQELFLDTLREEYQKEITDIIYECQFEGKNYLDAAGLNKALKGLRVTNFQSVELTEDHWYELIYELAPDIYDELSYGLAA